MNISLFIDCSHLDLIPGPCEDKDDESYRDYDHHYTLEEQLACCIPARIICVHNQRDCTYTERCD